MYWTKSICNLGIRTQLTTTTPT